MACGVAIGGCRWSLVLEGDGKERLGGGDWSKREAGRGECD
jgi:hypothetical protein